MLLATCMVLGDDAKNGIALILSHKLDALDPSALYLEAVGYARLDRMDAAEAVFRRLLENGSTRAQASFLMGQALHDGHRLQDAADAFSRECLVQIELFHAEPLDLPACAPDVRGIRNAKW